MNQPIHWAYLSLPLTIPMPVTKGFSAWADNDLTGTKTVTYSGNLNLGNNFPISSLSYTPAPGGAGWNLLGNPYPAPLQWNSSWTKSNLSEWACIHNNGHDECYNAATQTGWPNAGDMADGIIPSTQGFWVRTTSASATLTIPESERMFSDQGFYKDAAVAINESFRLKIEGNNDYDVLLVQFIKGATPGFDAQFDLEKRWGSDEAPQLYAIIGEDDYFSANALPKTEEGMIIPVGFRVATEDKYTISLEELKNMKEGMTVILEDIQTNTFTVMSTNSVYSFMASPLDKNHRFNIHLKSKALGNEEIGESLLSVYASDHSIYVQTPDFTLADVMVFDMTGREIIREKTYGDGITKFDLQTETGYYLVKVQTNDQLITRKVFIK